MKIVFKINLVLLVLLSLSTGIFKIIQQEADVVLFEKIGFNIMATTALGWIQLLGGILLIIPKSRLYGAYLMLPTFIVASIAVFANELIGFGIVSIVFILMSVIEIIHQRSTS